MSHTNTLLSHILKKATAQLTVGGLYTHYRDPSKKYIVTDVVLNESDEQPMVIYHALYGDKLKWSRSVDVWNQTVEHNGQIVPRFTLVSEP